MFGGTHHHNQKSNYAKSMAFCRTTRNYLQILQKTRKGCTDWKNWNRQEQERQVGNHSREKLLNKFTYLVRIANEKTIVLYNREFWKGPNAANPTRKYKAEKIREFKNDHLKSGTFTEYFAFFDTMAQNFGNHVRYDYNEPIYHLRHLAYHLTT